MPTSDHASINPSGRLLIVFDDDDGVQLLDVPLITAVECDQAPEDLRVEENPESGGGR